MLHRMRVGDPLIYIQEISTQLLFRISRSFRLPSEIATTTPLPACSLTGNLRWCRLAWNDSCNLADTLAEWVSRLLAQYENVCDGGLLQRPGKSPLRHRPSSVKKNFNYIHLSKFCLEWSLSIRFHFEIL